MADFEWQTEEEGVPWQATGPARVEPASAWRPPWRWLTLLGVLVVVGGTLFFSYRQVRERVRRATAEVEQEVLASHDLVRFAAEQRDREVLVTFLSGRDAEWSRLQQDLAEAGLLFDRQSLGLHLLPAGSPEQAARTDRRRVIGVTLSPELTEATVSVSQAYTVAVGNGVAETVYLRQDSLYRKGSDRWLYAPPEADPIYDEEAGAYVVLHYDRREGEIAPKLAADLDRKVAELCNLRDTVCPPDLTVHVSLAGDPALLASIGDPQLYLYENRLLEGEQDLSITLPAPSLVGVPVDEAGYHALYRGYATLVLRSLLTWVVWPWECCDHAPVLQALVEQQLVRLGLQPPPLGPAGYRQLLQEDFALFEDTMQSWYGRQFVAPGSRAWLEGQAVVAFLLAQEPRVSLPAAAAKLNEAANFWFWTYEFLGDRISDTELTQAWLEFAYERAGLTAPSPPGPWPAAEAFLLCGEEAAGPSLYRYEPAANTLVEELAAGAGATFVDLQPLPDGQGLLLLEESGNADDREVSIRLVQGGESRLLWRSRELARPLSYLSSAVHVSGKKLVVTVEGHEGIKHVLLDLAACDAGCAARVLPGQLLWSPDGAHALISSGEQLLLADGEGEVLRPAVTGYRSLPFWLDAGNYAYVRRAANEESALPPGELVAASVTTGEEWVLVSVDALAEMLPLGPEVYYLAGAFPSPARPDQVLLAVIAYTSSSSAADLFLLQRATGELTRLFNTGSWWSLQLSPDGKWLALQGFERAADRRVLYLHQFESGRRVQISQQEAGPFAWSPDGRWLLAAGGALLHLVAPEEEYRQVLVHPQQRCPAVAWLR